MRTRAKKTAKDKKDLRDIFDAAVKAASPYEAVRSKVSLLRAGNKESLKINSESIDLHAIERVFVLGAGKAACAMAQAVEDILGDRIHSGLCVTKYGHAAPLRRVEVIEAGHPVPDRYGLLGAKAILDIADKARERDLIIFLLSGGASALLAAPAHGITLREQQSLTRLLVNSGAAIAEINAVRKHLSAIKGGRLAQRIHPARVLTLVISDVVGNDLSVIGSGPTAPDGTAYGDCLSILKRYGLSGAVPAKILQVLKAGVKGNLEETPKPGSPLFSRCTNIIIADNLTALNAAKERAARSGYKALVLSSSITGNTREAAGFFCSILKEIRQSGNPVPTPACVIMGGETTIKVTGGGRGGRNQEFALSSVIALNGEKGIAVLSAGTDGTDGPTDAAGAFALPDTKKRAGALGLDPLSFLSDNDSNGFFKKLEDLLITGPTGTNVMDIAIGIVRSKPLN